MFLILTASLLRKKKKKKEQFASVCKVNLKEMLNKTTNSLSLLHDNIHYKTISCDMS